MQSLFSFGELLKAFRTRKHLTQQAFAARLGVHRNTISIWERGDYLPESKTVVLEVARQLDLDEHETRQLLEASLTALSPHWYLPYPRNPFFTGREEILQELHQKLHTNQAVALTQSYALHGLGGIGKTQTAVEYAYRYAQSYAAIFWIGAETAENIAASFLLIAELLGLPERRESDQRRMLAAVQRWLTNHGQWLLIWDNVEDPAALSPFLPPARQGALLFTTRRQSLGPLAHGMELQPMTKQEGLQFLLSRAGHIEPPASEARVVQIEKETPVEYAAAKELVAAMDGLPLALDQVGAYIEETQCSLRDYLHFYQSKRVELLRRRGEVVIHHPAAVATTWSLSFEKVEQADPAAADLLRLCAFLHPDAIPEEILTEGAPHLGERLGPVAADAFQLNEAISTTFAYSLLRRNVEEHTLSMHHLVQAVLRDGMDAFTAGLWMQRAVRAVNATFPEGAEFANWQRCERYVPHAQVCRLHIEQARISEPEGARLLHETGSYLLARGRYSEVEPLLVQALAMREQQHGPDHPHVAATLDSLAGLYQNQGKYEQAESLFQRALIIHQQQWGPEHPQTAGTLNNLAGLYWQQKRYEQAESLFRHALTIRQQHLGLGHPQTATSLRNLATLYSHQGKYEQAECLHRQALAALEQQLGLAHPQTANSLYSLARLYLEQGKYEQAEPLLQRALAIGEHQLGPDHPLTAIGLENLASLYLEQGKYEQAESLFQRALTILEQRLGPSHPHTVINLSGLASLYERQGKYEQAELLHQHALDICMQQLGSTDPVTARCLTGLASLYERQGKYEQAETLLQRALTIREQLFGPVHPDTARSLAGLAVLYEKQGNYEQAIPLFQRALAILEQRLGQAHPDTARAMKHYTSLLRQAEK